MLFSSTDLIKNNTEKSAESPHVSQGFSSGGHESAVYLTPEYKAFAAQLPEIGDRKVYDFVSFGQWNLKAVVFHLLTLTGPAEVFSTTYGLGPTASRAIVQALDDGLIRDFTFVYDHKVRTYKEEAHNLCSGRFRVKVTSIHAKITVLLNEKFGVVVSGSANWSDSNRKIELTTVTVDRERALFFRELIEKIAGTESSEPNSIYDELHTTGI